MDRGLTYHGFGSKYHRYRFDMPWIGGSIYHGYGVKNTMDRESKCDAYGGKIPWVECSIGYILGVSKYHG